ncbi:MAG: hypothetical protein DHS20C11_11890 [Lysobacteraceae bacterium]|nr:MAG: hypothetical protein DHS20C11_11890 [Xanthomonadaceae bacterium]
MRASKQATEYQHTVAAPIWLEQPGGSPSMRICPAPADHGIVFVRGGVALPDRRIPALWSHLDPKRPEVLSNRFGVTVSNLQDTLAALRLCGIDNARIDLTTDRLPNVAGGFTDLLQRLTALGKRRHSTLRRFIEVMRPVQIEGDTQVLSIEPSNGERHCIQTRGSEFAIDLEQTQVADWQTLRHGSALKSSIALIALAGAPVHGLIKSHAPDSRSYARLLDKLLNDRNNWRVGYAIHTAASSFATPVDAKFQASHALCLQQ